MGKFEKDDDFYVRFVFKEDVCKCNITIQYKNKNGITSGLTPTSVNGNIVQYNVPYSDNNVTGRWQFKAHLIKNGKRYKTNKKNIIIVDGWE